MESKFDSLEHGILGRVLLGRAPHLINLENENDMYANAISEIVLALAVAWGLLTDASFLKRFKKSGRGNAARKA